MAAERLWAVDAQRQRQRLKLSYWLGTLSRRPRRHKLGETPILEELDFEGAEVPSRDALEHLGGKGADPIALVDALSPDTRFFAFVMQRIDWQRAGFRKVQTINARRRRPGAATKRRHLVGCPRRSLPPSIGAVEKA